MSGEERAIHAKTEWIDPLCFTPTYELLRELDSGLPGRGSVLWISVRMPFPIFKDPPNA